MWAVLWNGLEEVVCSMAMWMLCVNCGVGFKLPVDFRWPVNIPLREGVHEVQDGGLWVWSGSSLPVQLPACCTVRMNILGFISHTPWIWAIKWAWLDYFRLT